MMFRENKRYIRQLIAFFIIPAVWLTIVTIGKVDFIKLVVFSYVFLVFSIGWDKWSTKQGPEDKLWGWRFNPLTISGLRVMNHPIEEYSFGFFVPYMMIVLWELINLAIYTQHAFYILSIVVFGLWEYLAVVFFYQRIFEEKTP